MPARVRAPNASLVGRVCLAGLLAMVLTGASGTAWVLWRLGTSVDATVTRVVLEVEAQFAARGAELQAAATTLGAHPDVAMALAGPVRDARRLFDLVAAVERLDDPDIALTVAAPDGTAVAWRGRPQSVPASRLTSARALFVAPGALGLRLVYVEPVMLRSTGAEEPPRPVGAIAAERILSPAGGVDAPSTFPAPLQTSLVPVQLTPAFVGGAIATRDADAFTIRTPAGDALVEATVSRAAVAALRDQAWRRLFGLMAFVLAITALLVAGVLAWERRWRRGRSYVGATAGAGLAVVLARALAWWAMTPGPDGRGVLSGEAYASALLPAVHRSPADLLATAVCALVLVALLVDPLRRWRLSTRGRRRDPLDTRQDLLAFVAVQLFAGAVVAVVAQLAGVVAIDTVNQSSVDLLNLSLFPAQPARLVVQLGLFGAGAALFWLFVLWLRSALLPWKAIGRTWVLRYVTPAGLWLTPTLLLVVLSRVGPRDQPEGAVLLLVGTAALCALLVSSGVAWFRRGTQARRLLTVYGLLLLPALLLYPLLIDAVDRARRNLVAEQYAVEAVSHPQELQARLSASLERLDRIDGLDRLVASVPRAPGRVPTDTAFTLWRQTDLATQRLTSAIEIYAPDGVLVSRFALNFPEYDASVTQWRPTACAWDIFGEGAQFGSEERRMLHAQRAICTRDPASGIDEVVGGIIVHVMLDYSSLPFLSSQGPYVDLLRGPGPAQRDVRPPRDVDLVLYGWGRSAIYASGGRVWPLPDAVFDRAYQSRDGFWATQRRGSRLYDIYVTNDRLAIYVVGYPRISAFGHFIRLAEVATLAGFGTVLLLGAMSLLHWVNRRGLQPGTRLLREIRASFTRKLFLAFVATSVIPVVILALLVRTFVANRLRADVEAEASRTASVAQRVIEDTLALQQPTFVTATVPSDDVLVWISRVIAHDVNIFDGATLAATSQRDLYASGLLPERTPDAVYRAIALQRLPSFVGEDQIGGLRHIVAAAPVRLGGGEAILTVPMALRQQEIEAEIAELDRSVNLGAIVFILLGAALGYSIAERIGDPVQRLTRASRRIAAGDLDQRVVARTADELQRLVEAFNSMAEELLRQRVQLERTHRLEAWAEMARQVAHDIKNPLTPIQLAAEHLRRVHADRGKPLSPVLESCVDTILLQVRMLRQISSEFASFASSPTPRLTTTSAASIVAEVVGAYRTGLPAGLAVVVETDPSLPPVLVDRVLLGRAMTNVIENALHAMPSGGTLTVRTRQSGPALVDIALIDTGVGMDSEALARLFEPYFSTKATGTGLGLSIARRNIDLMGGQIQVESEKGRGTRSR
jgi:two-component system, NtrC family, nitrogen regulation sensor histidine kinase NtrY